MLPDIRQPDGALYMNEALQFDDSTEWLAPETTTPLIHQSVPLLRFVGFHLVSVLTTQVRGILPLRVESTNHNGSHFGMAIGMAADTVGAVLIAKVVGPVQVIGLHPQIDDNGAAIWLTRSTLEFVRPSVDDLVVTASVSAAARERMRRRYLAGQRVIEEVDITCEARGTVIARGTLTYIAQPARAFKPRTTTARTSLLYQHKVTASARLVAAVRAMEAAQTHPLFIDPWAAHIGDAHGRFLANRMTHILPALPAMIAARTRYFDDAISHAVEKGVRQVLILGVGFDTRMFQLPVDTTALTVYEIDLPDMIAARETLLAEVTDLPILRREALGLNLELEDLPQRLLEETSFCPTQPTIALFEGVSMYLDAQVNYRILAALGSVLQHPESRLGLDLIAETVVSRNTDFAEARELIDGMRELGEPFLFGISDPATYFASQGYEVLDQAPANCYRHEQPAALFDLYRFLIVRPAMHSDSPMAVR